MQRWKVRQQCSAGVNIGAVILAGQRVDVVSDEIRQRECAQRATFEKVLPRDRTAYLNHCLDEMAAKQ